VRWEAFEDLYSFHAKGHRYRRSESLITVEDGWSISVSSRLGRYLAGLQLSILSSIGAAAQLPIPAEKQMRLRLPSSPPVESLLHIGNKFTDGAMGRGWR
jgi:hypothetical protein